MLTLLTGGICFSQVPILDSDPSITNRVLYLDFDGQVVTGTNWNTAYSTPTINAAASTLSNANKIIVWKRMAEDFRPFNVNVTTDVAKFNAAPANRRMRIIVTPTSSWYPSAAGGVAYLNSFSWGGNPDTPCWVFENALSYNPKNVAEAASHEAGHTLSLRHQSIWNASCVKTAEYHNGLGSGVTSWAPIMGVGYSRNVTIWHNGPNSVTCTALQFDHGSSGITGANFLSYRTDDVGNTYAAAKLLVLSTPVVLDSGIISTNTDIDVFKFDLCNNRYVTIDVKPWALDTVNYSGANLDVRLTLVNATTSSTIAVDTPLVKLNALIGVNLGPGSYYFVIDGGGSANYSDYGSMGLYYIKVTSNNIPAITSNFNNAGPYCTGSPIAFTDASTGSPTAWSWTLTGGTPANSTQQNPLVTYNTAGTYSITLSASNSTASSCPVTKTIQVVTSPTVNVVANPLTICSSQSATLSASGAASYLWNTSATTSVIVVSPTVNSNYTVTGTTSGCSQSKTIAITVNPQPTIVTAASASAICQGAVATLSASGANTYTWSNSATTSTISVSPSVTTVYTVTGTGANGCSNTSTIQLVVQVCSGIDSQNIENYGFSVYPNPGSGLIIIKPAVTDNYQAILYNQLGQIIQSTELSTIENVLDFTSEANGVYQLIILKDGKKVAEGKLIKQ